MSGPDRIGWKRRVSREIRAEIEDHVERRTRALMAKGFAPEAARAEALRRIGDVERIEEACMRIAGRQRSRAHVARWFDDAARDVTVALRSFRRRPLLAAGVILTMALAIGAATSVFSLVRGVLLAPLGFPQPDNLYSVYTRYLPETGYDFEYFGMSGPELVDYREFTRTMTGVAAYFRASVNLTPRVGEPERLSQVVATPNVFEVLGVSPALGRGFVESDGEPSASCVTVLSNGLWRDRFGAATDIIDGEVRLDGRPCRVLGVMPPGFGFPDDQPRLYTVLKLDPTSPLWGRVNHGFLGVARLYDTATPAMAQAELDALRARWSEDYPELTYALGHFLVLRPLVDDVVGDARSPLLVLLGAVGVVLVIVIVNVAGLILASAESRRREFAVRAALGVGRTRLARQLVTESLLLVSIGGALGVIASIGFLRGLITLYPGDLSRGDGIHIDGAVLLFSSLVTIASGLLVGAFPAIRMSAVHLSEVLRSAARGLTAHGGGVRVRRAFVMAQAGLALVLALGAALLARSYAHVRAVDLGFDPARVLTFLVFAPEGSYPESSRARDYFLRLEARLNALPGVDAAGAVSDLPLRSGGGADDFIIEGKTPPGQGQPGWNARYQMATTGALVGLGLRLVAGRWFEPADIAGSPPVAVINEATARAYFPGQDPIGTRLRYYGQDSTWITIVGIVGDVRQLGVTEDPPPAVYTSLAQAPRPAYAGRTMNLVVRFRGDPTLGVNAVREAMAEIDPTLPLGQLMTLDDVVNEATGDSRFTTTVMSAFALVALLLGALGLYGLLAHAVNLRAHEIGIRLALGARPRSVLGMVVTQGMMLVLAGVAFGVLAALALRRALDGLLFGVGAFDPLSLALAGATLVLVSLAACSVPAWRAARLDPLTSLRAD
ncbi:MAG: ADOP family duplicated permease [Longimicrobiales bacterium]